MKPSNTLGALLTLALMTLSAGCAWRSGRVDSGMLIPTLGAAADLSEHQRFLFPTPVMQLEDPVFPASELMSLRNQAVVCLEFVVGEDGGVASVKPMDETPECPQSHDSSSPFSAAAMDVVLRWQFLAGAICTFPQGTVPDDACDAEGVVVETVPVRLFYRFVFRVVGGKSQVLVGRSGDEG